MMSEIEEVAHVKLLTHFNSLPSHSQIDTLGISLTFVYHTGSMYLLKSLTEHLHDASLPHTLNVTFDSGGKDKTCVVLLHGIAATSMTWDNLRYKLDYAQYRVIALDLLGFGRSPIPKRCDYTLDDHSVYVRRTLSKLGVKTPFVIVGHSMGALISVHYMTKWPDDVMRGVLVSMPIYSRHKDSKFPLLHMETDLFLNTYRFFRSNPDFTIKGAQMLRKLLNLKDGIDVRADNWEAFSRSLRNSIEHQSTYQELQEINSPLSLIYGKLDEFAGRQNIESVAKLLGVKITLVDASDHAINDRMARKIAEAIHEGKVRG